MFFEKLKAKIKNFIPTRNFIRNEIKDQVEKQIRKHAFLISETQIQIAEGVNASTSDAGRRLDILKGKLGFIAYHFEHIVCLSSCAACNRTGIIYRLLTPMTPRDGKKTRLGCRNDGGYVMAEIPECKAGPKIAYSFGISDYDPWSLEMVARGYEVFQYDGTVEQGPYNDPRIHFFRYMITGSGTPRQNERNFRQITAENGHENGDIMLNIDIEGAEWDFFASLTDDEMRRFEQIVVEYHGLCVNDDETFEKQKAVLEKINKTHQVIHLHGNNCSPATVLPGLTLLPFVMEVTYLRKTGHEFIACLEEFPGELDSPNSPDTPDIYLGVFHSNEAAK